MEQSGLRIGGGGEETGVEPSPRSQSLPEGPGEQEEGAVGSRLQAALGTAVLAPGGGPAPCRPESASGIKPIGCGISNSD